MLKYEIKKEEVILKLNLAAVEGKKFDLAKDLLDRGYTLGDIEGFMKNV